MTEPLSLTQNIPAAPDLAFRMFTTPFLLKQWLCNDCKVDAREGGKFFLLWNDGNHAVGTYTAYQPGSHLAFTWQYNHESAPTQVDVRLSAERPMTRVQLTHEGFSDEQAREKAEREWRISFENLSYTLETGFDYRLMSRPMLGVYPMSNNELQTAQRHGLDTSRGVLLGGVVPGSGAEAAGLQKDDAILKIAGKDLKDFSGFAQILAPYKGGDIVEIEFLRDGTVHSAEMTLTKRTLPDLATTPEDLAQMVRKTHVAVDLALTELIKDVPEEVLKAEPAGGEWSVYEIMSHLLFSERYLYTWMWAMASGDDAVPWNDNNILQRAPLLALYSTTHEMLEELRRAQAGLVALAQAIPPTVVENKALFAQMASTFTGFDQHANTHIEQIRQTLNTVAPATA